MKNNTNQNGFQHDMSQYYPAKAALESVFGKDSWYKLKETTDLNVWKKEVDNLLSAILIASKETVKIADDDFHIELNSIIRLGKSHLKTAKSAADLFSFLSGTLIRISFLQIGFAPQFSGKSKSLKTKNWNLSAIRSVQYVQTEEQKSTARELKKK